MNSSKKDWKIMIDKSLIAPCGMNCALCQAYQGKGLNCNGCGKVSSRKSCTNCSILKCNRKDKYCFECNIYPCARLCNLDKRYKTKYGMSMLENLDTIKTRGMDYFLEYQYIKYTCSNCGYLRTVHQTYCFYCTNNTNKGRKDDK